MTRTSLIPTSAVLVAGLLFCACSDDDCDPCPAPVAFSHADHFAANPYIGPNMNVACIGCHAEEVQDMMASGHFNWEGTAANMVGFETEVHGKTDVINNFCIAIPTNEGRCTMCHAGVGWDDYSFGFGDTQVDCLVCHDTSGLYKKAAKKAGAPCVGDVMVGTPPTDAEWAQMAAAIGMPDRHNCGMCHYGAGGGDNVKHGDLAVNLNDTTRDYDVHMGTDGGNMTCTMCHGTDEDHGIGGMPYHSVTEGNMMGCAACHTATPHDSGTEALPSIARSHTAHGNLSCQACHIPFFARHTETKVDWDWSTAGAATDPTSGGTSTAGRPNWDRKKGTFTWASDVRPTLRRFDGTWMKMLIGENDTFTGTPSPTNPVVLGEPLDPSGSNMIYPFKKMTGKQAADTTNDQILVPHLFGSKGGAHSFWAGAYPSTGHWDWALALQDGASPLAPTDNERTNP